MEWDSVKPGRDEFCKTAPVTGDEGKLEGGDDNGGVVVVAFVDLVAIGLGGALMEFSGIVRSDLKK